jgi:hypothetical protein
MMENETIADRIGELAERADNIFAATKLPVSDHLHVIALKAAMARMARDLRALYIELTGDDIWADGAWASTEGDADA